MAIAAAIFKNGINRIITNLTGTMVGVIIPGVILITVGRCTVSSPNFTSDITLADRAETGTDTDNGVIDPFPVTVTPDGITGDITTGQ